MDFIGTPLQHVVHITFTVLKNGFEERPAHAPPSGWNHTWACILDGLIEGEAVTVRQVEEIIAEGVRSNARRYLAHYKQERPDHIAEPSVIAFGIRHGDLSFKELAAAGLTPDQIEEIRYEVSEGEDIIQEMLYDLRTMPPHVLDLIF